MPPEQISKRDRVIKVLNIIYVIALIPSLVISFVGLFALIGSGPPSWLWIGRGIALSCFLLPITIILSILRGKKSLLWYLLPILPIISLFLLNNLEGKKLERNNEPTIQQALINTSTWQTYRNEEFGYEFKVPPTWSKGNIYYEDFTGAELDGGGVIIFFQLKPYQPDPGPDNAEYYRDICMIEIYKSADWDKLQSDDAPERLTLIGSRHHQLLGEMKYSWKCGHDDYGYIGFEKYNQASKDGNLKDINNGQILGPFQEFWNLILPTFKFIDSVDTSTWQTYLNEEYGFEFKYPADWTNTNSDILVGNYFMSSPKIEVLSIKIIKENTNIQTIARSDIQQNNCPIDDQIIRQNDKGILYTLSCSATTEDYMYLTVLQAGKILQFNYHNNFEKDWTIDQKLKTFDQILSTFKFVTQ